MNRSRAIFLHAFLAVAISAPLLLTPTAFGAQRGNRADASPPGPVRRMSDGTPDISGLYRSNAGGANYGLEQKGRDFLTPASRGVVIEPPDGILPYREWARAERIERELPHRGYERTRTFLSARQRR